MSASLAFNGTIHKEKHYPVIKNKFGLKAKYAKLHLCPYGNHIMWTSSPLFGKKQVRETCPCQDQDLKIETEEECKILELNGVLEDDSNKEVGPILLNYIQTAEAAKNNQIILKEQVAEYEKQLKVAREAHNKQLAENEKQLKMKNNALKVEREAHKATKDKASEEAKTAEEAKAAAAEEKTKYDKQFAEVKTKAMKALDYVENELKKNKQTIEKMSNKNSELDLLLLQQKANAEKEFKKNKQTIEEMSISKSSSSSSSSSKSSSSRRKS